MTEPRMRTLVVRALAPLLPLFMLLAVSIQQPAVPMVSLPMIMPTTPQAVAR